MPKKKHAKKKMIEVNFEFNYNNGLCNVRFR